MPKPDLDPTHLRKLAEAADASGMFDWKAEVLDDRDGAWEVTGPGLVACSDGDFLDESSARHIAACDPATILALLDERDRALEHLAAAHAILAHHGDIDSPGLTQEGNQALGQVAAAISALRGDPCDTPTPRTVRLRHPEGGDDEQPF